MARILVVDDEVGIRELLSEILYDEGHTIELAENAAQARAARLRGRPDLVLLDIWMPDTDGVTLLKEWSATGLLDMPVIMMSGHATIDTAVEATKIGAIDFLEKPITLQRLLKTISTGLARGRSTVAKSASGGFAAVAPAAAAPATLPPSATTSPATVAAPAMALEQGLLGDISLDQPLREARDEFERVYFEYHLARENNSMTRVSDKTGLERTHLYRKLKQLGIEARKRNS
jgi:DNA-binding NtrC family response regulator